MKGLISFLKNYCYKGDAAPGSIETLVSNQEKLRSLPAEIAGLTSLTTLIFRDNHLESIPAEIGNLPLLTSIDLSSNMLKEIPAEIGMLKSLVKLDLSNNSLIILPESFGGLQKLVSLHLQSNKLKTLPIGFGNLKLLQNLDISNNFIESFPKEILELKSLILLNISNNRLLTVSNWSFENGQVEIKEYYSTNLESFPVNISDYFPYLSTLILSNKDKLLISIGELEIYLQVSFGQNMAVINGYKEKWQEYKKVVEALLVHMAEELTGLVIEYYWDFQPLKIKPECIKFSSITLEVTRDGASMQLPGPESKETTPKP